MTLSRIEEPLETEEQRHDPAKKKEKPKYCVYRPRQEQRQLVDLLGEDPSGRSCPDGDFLNNYVDN